MAVRTLLVLPAVLADHGSAGGIRGYRARPWEHSVDADDPGSGMNVDVAGGRSLVLACDRRGARNREIALKNTQAAADFTVAILLDR